MTGMTAVLSPTRFVAVIALVFCAGCASYRPLPIDQLMFRDRVETQQADGLRVSVSVLSREEARQAFGVNFQKRGIHEPFLHGRPDQQGNG